MVLGGVKTYVLIHVRPSSAKVVAPLQHVVIQASRRQQIALGPHVSVGANGERAAHNHTVTRPRPTGRSLACSHLVGTLRCRELHPMSERAASPAVTTHPVTAASAAALAAATTDRTRSAGGGLGRRGGGGLGALGVLPRRCAELPQQPCHRRRPADVRRLLPPRTLGRALERCAVGKGVGGRWGGRKYGAGAARGLGRGAAPLRLAWRRLRRRAGGRVCSRRICRGRVCGGRVVQQAVQRRRESAQRPG